MTTQNDMEQTLSMREKDNLAPHLYIISILYAVHIYMCNEQNDSNIT